MQKITRLRLSLGFSLCFVGALIACEPTSASRSPSGSVHWSRTYPLADVAALRLLPRTGGGAYAAFLKTGEATFDDITVGTADVTSLVVAAFGEEGDLVWAKAFAGDFADASGVAFVAHDDTSLYVSAVSGSTWTVEDTSYAEGGGAVMLVMATSDGSLSRVVDLQAHTAGWSVENFALVGGELYATGRVDDGATSVLRVAQMTLGTGLWQRTYDLSTDVGDCRGHAMVPIGDLLYVAAEGSGVVAVGDGSVDLGTTAQHFVAALGWESPGALWVQPLGPSEVVPVVAAAAGGDLLVAGDFLLAGQDPLADSPPITDFPVLSVMRLPVASQTPKTPLWWWRIGERTLAPQLRVASMVVGPNDHVYLAASMLGDVQIAGRTLRAPQGEALLVVRLDTDGQAHWSQYSEESDYLMVSDIALNPDEGPLVGGIFRALPQEPEDGEPAPPDPEDLFFMIQFTD